MTDVTPVRTALRALSRLNDAEQYFIWGWFATGAREYLNRVGVADDVVGPVPLFPEDRCTPYDGPAAVASAELLRAIDVLRDVPHDDVLALKAWFFWHKREPLYRLGLTDADIGSRRVIPDDIWPYEPAYAAVNDGTLTFLSGRRGTLTVRVLLDGTWQDP